MRRKQIERPAHQNGEHREKHDAALTSLRWNALHGFDLPCGRAMGEIVAIGRVAAYCAGGLTEVHSDCHGAVTMGTTPMGLAYAAGVNEAGDEDVTRDEGELVVEVAEGRADRIIASRRAGCAVATCEADRRHDRKSWSGTGRV